MQLRPEDGSYDADCGKLVVPENRADPRSRLIALPVTRIRARTAHPGAEGGPGLTNMKLDEASRYAHRRAPRTVFATGHGMLGVTLAPLTGRLVAEIVAGSASHSALSALTPERF